MKHVDSGKAYHVQKAKRKKKQRQKQLKREIKQRRKKGQDTTSLEILLMLES